MSTETNSLKLSSDSSLFIHLIRIIAAEAVVVGHSLSFFKIYPNAETGTPRYMQNIGVLVFFILSGLLIAHSTLSKKKKYAEYGFKSYFMDRFVRIFSGFLPALVLVAILDYSLIYLYGKDFYIYNSLNIKSFVGNVFMLQDFPVKKLLHFYLPSVTSFGSARPFWTVAVEWWMYLFFGMLFFWKEIKIHPAIKLVLFAVISIVPFFNLIGGRGNGLTLVWFLGAGILLLLMNNNIRPVNKTWCFISGMAMFGIALLRYLAIKTEYDLVFASILGLSLLFFLYGLQQTNIIRANWLKKTIIFMADYSFSLYLLHYTIIHFFVGQIGNYPKKGLFLASLIAANLVSIIFALITEMKHKQLRKWIAAKYKI